MFIFWSNHMDFNVWIIILFHSSFPKLNPLLLIHIVFSVIKISAFYTNQHMHVLVIRIIYIIYSSFCRSHKTNKVFINFLIFHHTIKTFLHIRYIFILFIYIITYIYDLSMYK